MTFYHEWLLNLIKCFSCSCVCVCSAQLCPTLWDSMDCNPPGSSNHGILPGKNTGVGTGVGCYFLLQGIFLNQRSSLHILCLLHWQVDSLPLHHLGSGKESDYSQGKKSSGSDVFTIDFYLTLKTEDEMAGWHHWLDGRESGWTPGVGDGQGGLACCNSWGGKESDTTERLNWKNRWFLCYLNFSPRKRLKSL